MRILHVVTLLDDENSYGGPVSVALGQAQETIRRGHDVTLIAGWLGIGQAPSSVEGVPAKLFPMTRVSPGSRFAGLVSFEMLRWLNAAAHEYDIAHIHLSRDLNQLAAHRILRLRSVPVVVQTHGMILPDSRLRVRLTDLLLTKKALCSSEARFVLTEAEGEQLRRVGHCSSLSILRNGVTVPPERKAAHSDGIVDVLFLARLHPGKGVLAFAEAARLLKGRDDVRFSIVGPDGGDLPALLQFRQQHGLEKSLRYEGALSHEAAAKRIAKADVYVLPSMKDAYPMSVLEALAAGIPTVCTERAGFAALLSRENAAIVCPPEASVVARELAKLLDSPGIRLKYARQARLVAAREFSLESVVDSLIQAYSTILARTEGKRARSRSRWMRADR